MAKQKSEFVKWMGPMLDALRELGGSGKSREVVDLIAERCGVADSRLEETLKSGQTRFQNQVHWARQYLVWEGLLDSSTRDVWTLTPEGFERICARLLRESGFEKVTVTGRPRDGGIDGIGILQVNPFVSFRVLFQCKRYKGAVSRAQVGDFRNAMIGRADKGIIMTTGTFTMDARREADRDGAPPIELVDAQKLVEMFKRVELGLKPTTIYEVNHAFFAPFLPA